MTSYRNLLVWQHSPLVNWRSAWLTKASIQHFINDDKMQPQVMFFFEINYV